jgi:hypothetical protein
MLICSKEGHEMIRAMIKATAKVIKEMPWWQKVLIGSAAAVAFSAAAKVMEYFIQEIEEPLHKKEERIVRKRGSGR